MEKGKTLSMVIHYTHITVLCLVERNQISQKLIFQMLYFFVVFKNRNLDAETKPNTFVKWINFGLANESDVTARAHDKK